MPQPNGKGKKMLILYHKSLYFFFIKQCAYTPIAQHFLLHVPESSTGWGLRFQKIGRKAV